MVSLYYTSTYLYLKVFFSIKSNQQIFEISNQCLKLIIFYVTLADNIHLWKFV